MAIKGMWINLPVKDVAKSIEFYNAIGFVLNTAHGNSNDSACFLVGEKNMVVMLFQEDVFRRFTKNDLADTSKSSEVLISFDADDRAEIDAMVNSVEAAGGRIFSNPSDKQGWMYGFGFADIDGHRWNMLHMDMSKIPIPVVDTKECIVIHTLINSTLKKVWRCFTQPEHIVNWNNASKDWQTINAINDLTTGGKFTYRMEAKDGSMGFDFVGHYSHIKTEEDIAFMLLDGRKVNIHFEKVAEGVKVTESFEPEKENTAELQKQGWQAILNNFKSYVENN